MKKYQYIIVGGGMTGSAAAMGIRKHDPQGTIAVFSKEKDPPYNRPPLTKSLWAGKKIEDIIRPIENLSVDLHLNTPIMRIDRVERIIEDNNGEKYQYEKLLLATGGKPIRLPDSPDGLIYYRTLQDFKQLKDLTTNKSKFCVIGGGFIGSEVAAALCNQGMKVTMIFPEKGISGTRFPADLSAFLNNYYQEKGVTILQGHKVIKIVKEEDGFLVKYAAMDSDMSEEKHFDAVIVGIGISPNIELANDAGLTVGNGIVVNEYLQTEDPDIFAAGDVANFVNLQTGKRERVEHEDAANTMGMVAGKNMTGELIKYDHFPFFYSDLFDLGFEAVGELNPQLEVIEDWVDPFKKGTVYYLSNGKVNGVIFWDLWGFVEQGAALITSGKTYSKDELMGRIQ